MFHFQPFFAVPLCPTRGPLRCQIQMTSATATDDDDCFVPSFFSSSSSSIVLSFFPFLPSLPPRSIRLSSPLFRIALLLSLPPVCLPSFHVIRRSGAVKIRLLSRETRRLRLLPAPAEVEAIADYESSRGWSKFLNE